MKEQAADFTESFEVGGEVQSLVAEDATELLALLGERRYQVAVKWPVGADGPKDLAGAADRAGIEVLKHEDIKVVGGVFALAAETGFRFLQLGFERVLFGRKVGETAPGQFGEVIEGAEIARARGPDPIAHAPSANRMMVRADSAARSARL